MDERYPIRKETTPSTPVGPSKYIRTYRALKLVRDNIPDLLTEEMKAKNPRFFSLNSLPEYNRNDLWLEKIQEELDELKKAVEAESLPTDKVAEELCDVFLFLEGFKSAMFSGHLENRYDRIMESKYHRNGGVWNRTVMEYDEEDKLPDDE